MIWIQTLAQRQTFSHEGAKEPDDYPRDASMEVDERESSESSDSEVRF